MLEYLSCVLLKLFSVKNCHLISVISETIKLRDLLVFIERTFDTFLMLFRIFKNLFERVFKKIAHRVK